jgi:hydrogenase-4 component E
MTMNVDIYQTLAISAAVIAVLMLGTTHLKGGLVLYGLHTILVAAQGAFAGGLKTDWHDYLVPLAFAFCKGIGVPIFLNYVMKKIGVADDVGTYLPPPMCMHMGIMMLGVSYILASHMPGVVEEGDARIGAMAAMSMLFTGMLLMLTRKLAISQLIGFLVMENGIYVFACSHTNGMPMLVEMGVLMDALVGVIAAGLLFNSIKKSFEHIDVTRLTDLKD